MVVGAASSGHTRPSINPRQPKAASTSAAIESGGVERDEVDGLDNVDGASYKAIPETDAETESLVAKWQTRLGPRFNIIVSY